jgi:dipeptidyl aminopeptidase/acylaminoacyl peptidase
MRRLLLAATAAATIMTGAAMAQTNVPLVPRDVLFGNPVKANARISPDGKWLSWTAPLDGVMNVWVAPASDPNAAKAITNEKTRPIRQYFWAPDSSAVMFINDKGGDEDFLLYAASPTGGDPKLLTPYQKTTVQVVSISPTIRDRILIGLNNRDQKWHDVHSLDLRTGQVTPVLMNTGGFAGFTADANLTVRMAAKSRNDGGTDFFRVEGGKVADTPFASVGLEDSQTTSPAGFTADGKTLYWVDSRGRNTAALVAQDVASGSTKVIAEDARADIGGAITNPRTGVVEAYAVNYLRNDWKPVGGAITRDLAFLKQELKGDFAVTSRTTDDKRWVVAAAASDRPSASYLYDRSSRRLTKLFDSRPALAGVPLAPMQSLEIKSRDGLTLPTYLTLPPGSDSNGDGRPDAPVPMVLLVHGGPWARDGYGFNSAHQWLANRGYAVMSTNFRASTGFGKSFLQAGNGEWGKKMHDDLLDAVGWAVNNKVTTNDKVAIMGGSYGGYATLAGLTFTPDAFACGVAIVAPSNLETLLATTPAYWESFRRQLYARMADPTTEAGKAWLKERSPLHFADRIQKPLLIGQGANDPRVKQAEADQIVDAMRTRNIPVTYVLFPDEGHGFARPVNNIAFNAVAENFLARCLGGRAEPIGDTVAKSSAKVPHGAQYAPGLAEAIKAGPSAGSQ